MPPAGVTLAVFDPPAVPVMVTSDPAKPVTGSLKVAVKLMGDAPVGSPCPDAWPIVTDGRAAS